MDKTSSLALELVDIPDEFVNLLREAISKRKGTELITIDQHLFLFPVNDQIENIIEEASFHYSHDVGAYQLRIVQFNNDKTSFEIASKFISSNPSVIVEDDGLIIIDDLVNLLKAINKHQEENTNDEDSISTSSQDNNEDNDYSSTDEEAFAQDDAQIDKEFEQITSSQQQPSTDNQEQEGESAGFQDNAELNEIFNDTSAEQDQDEQEASEGKNPSDSSDLDNKPKELSQQSSLNYNEAQNNGLESESYEQPTDVLKDYDNDNARIYEVARHILDSETEPISLAGLNIPSNLEPEAINVTNEDYQQRINLLNQICNSLSNNYHANWKNVENEKIQAAQKANQQNNEKIKTNSLKQKQLEQDQIQNDYAKTKEQFIKSQIPKLEAQFDSENQDMLAAQIEKSSSDIDQKTTERIKEQQDNLDAYINTLRNLCLKHTVRIADVSDFVKDYQHQQKKLLSDFAEKVAQANSTISDLNQRLQEKDDQIANLKNTQEERVQTAIDKALIKEQKKQSTENQRKFIKYQKELDSFEKRLKDQESIIEQQKKLIDQTNNVNANASNKNVPASPITVPNTENKSWKYSFIGLLAILVCVCLIFFFGPNNQQPASIQQPPVQSSITTSNQHNFKKGDTFTYTNEKNKKIKIYVDDKHSGHYRDKQGKVHTVTF
ncbi:hypothetical protein GYW21_09445 [Lactobacillus mellis]|nr:hypothetical protein [Bombilactobacillus mellis]